MLNEWFTTAQLLKFSLPGLPTTPQNIRTFAKRNNWKKRNRLSGKGFEFHFSNLSAEQQAFILKKFVKKPDAPAKASVATVVSYDRESAWTVFDKKSKVQKSKANQKLLLLQQVLSLHEDQGVKLVEAFKVVAKANEVSHRTMMGWYYGTPGKIGVQNVNREDWLAALVPGFVGRTAIADCDEEIWDIFKADYLRVEAPAASACYLRALAVANERGLSVPCETTMRRKLEREVPRAIRILMREGEHALTRMFPAQERDISMLSAMEWINGDGYQHNVFVKWPDGTIARPKTWYWQDIHSRRLLSWRTDQTEHTDLLMLSMGDLIEEFGIPEHCTIDNTRAAANKWMTGGVPNRYRFKVKADDPLGLLPTLGVKVHWTSVLNGHGWGQAKPIERAFGVGGLGEYVDKHPAFAGAFTGPNPMAKPENYGSAAVPLETFLQVMNDAVLAWNAKTGRRTQSCSGQLSYDQAFNASYQNAVIRKATAEQRRLWLLSAEGVRVQHDGTIALEAGSASGVGKNRYHDEALYPYAGKKVLARFDPQSLHAEVYVYTLDNRFISSAECIAATGFGDRMAAREHKRARAAMVKATKQAAEAEVRMTALEAAEKMPKTDKPPEPETKVVSGVFRQQGNAAIIVEEDEEITDTEQSFSTAVSYLRAGRKPSL